MKEFNDKFFSEILTPHPTLSFSKGTHFNHQNYICVHFTMIKYVTFQTFLVEHQKAGKKRNGVSLPHVGARKLSARQPGSFLNKSMMNLKSGPAQRVLDDLQRTRLSDHVLEFVHFLPGNQVVS